MYNFIHDQIYPEAKAPGQRAHVFYIDVNQFTFPVVMRENPSFPLASATACYRALACVSSFHLFKSRLYFLLPVFVYPLLIFSSAIALTKLSELIHREDSPL